MLELLLDPQAWIALITLIALELVLGIDNIIFISILVDKVPRKRREFTRMTGLFLAMFMRIALLFLLSLIVGLVAPLFTVLGQEISGRDLILIAGGVFIIWKSTKEIHQLLIGGEDEASRSRGTTFSAVILQIAIIARVFSLDSVIPAGIRLRFMRATRTRRRGLVVFCAAIVLAPLMGSAFGRSAYPSRPFKLVVPYPPGGLTDLLARAIGDRLAASLKQPVVVD